MMDRELLWHGFAVSIVQWSMLHSEIMLQLQKLLHGCHCYTDCSQLFTWKFILPLCKLKGVPLHI